MKCIYCGEELKEGSLYCPNCGKAAQIVPDYNIYDEDYLNQVLAEENQNFSVSPKTAARTKCRPKPISAGKKKAQTRQQQKILLMVAAVLCVLVFALLLLGTAIRSNHANSFSYQVQLAEKAQKAGDTQKAIEYYENALALDSTSIDVRLTLAQLYEQQKAYDSALVLYQEVIREDKKNRAACKGLIAIYENQNNMDAILSLSKAVDARLSDLFTAYQVPEPKFSLKSGIFDEAQLLQMISEKGDAIYYTLDGSDPSETGIRYTKPITLEENNKTYTVKAVCKNSKGIYSSVTQQVYTISIPAPDAPSVTPDGGNFTTATTVRIRVPDGCSAYYTWDGSTPTAGSRRYTGPITVPEGNHVLSVVLIDRETGLRSEVYRGNFIYNSQDYSTVEDTQDSEPSEAEDLISDINHTDDTDDEPGYVDGADE